MKRTTIRELGQQLPIGIPSEDGKLIKTFEVRPYKARIDRHLGIWREANANKSIAYLVTQYVAMILKSIGSKAFALDTDGSPTDETIFDITQLFFADVMYIYVWSRITELDPFVWKPIQCPICKVITPNVSFDLLDSDVEVIEKIEELEQWVKLRKGFDLRKGGSTMRAKLHPVKWGVMHHEGVIGGAVDKAGYVQLQHSIVGVDGHEKAYTPTEEELDELHKVDMLLLDRESNRVTAGLSMQTEIKCPGEPKKETVCGFEITDALDWTFDSFFDSSFALNPPKTEEAEGEQETQTTT